MEAPSFLVEGRWKKTMLVGILEVPYRVRKRCGCKRDFGRVASGSAHWSRGKDTRVRASTCGEAIGEGAVTAVAEFRGGF